MGDTLKVILKKTGTGDDTWTWELHDANGYKVAEGNYMSSAQAVRENF